MSKAVLWWLLPACLVACTDSVGTGTHSVSSGDLPPTKFLAVGSAVGQVGEQEGTLLACFTREFGRTGTKWTYPPQHWKFDVLAYLESKGIPSDQLDSLGQFYESEKKRTLELYATEPSERMDKTCSVMFEFSELWPHSVPYFLVVLRIQRVVL
jgi:hypothetical protein